MQRADPPPDEYLEASPSTSTRAAGTWARTAGTSSALPRRWSGPPSWSWGGRPGPTSRPAPSRCVSTTSTWPSGARTAAS
eukprot:8202673-Alexandrium_andersonii.AAC.1